MDYSEFYGKFWNYSPRQWRNVGIVFEGDTTGINKGYMLDVLEENGDRLGYVLFFIQIMILKQEIANNKWYIVKGLRPEMIYDRWTLQTTKLVRYVRDENGNVKPKIAERPYTHVYNCYRTWLKQLMYEIKHKVGRYDHRTNLVDELTIQLEPEKINRWIDAFSEEWIAEWVYDPDHIREDEDDRVE